MSQYQIITHERFGHRRWQRFQSYAFARQKAVVPLVVSEVIRAATLFPIGFVLQGKHWQPAAIMGQCNDVNLFVGPNGAWVGAGYVPAALRSYPFSLLPGKNGQYLLCIDEESGLITEDCRGELFFDENCQPSQSINKVLSYLRQVEQHRRQTLPPCDALATYGLLKPWTLEFTRPQGSLKLEGIYTIDEARLNSLSGEVLAKLRDAGALTLAYAQMLSSHLLPQLDRLAQAHEKSVTPPSVANFEIENLLGTNGDVLRFNF